MTKLEAQLGAGPEAIAALLLAAGRPLSLQDPANHWHGLAEGSAQNASQAFERGNAPLGLSWTRCAVAIYDALADDIVESSSFDLSSMYARVRAIRASGSHPGDPVLDPEVIVRWVRSALIRSVGEALDLSAKFRAALASGAGPSLDDGRKLRRIKNRLGVLHELDAASSVPADLRPWLEVRDQLL